MFQLLKDHPKKGGLVLVGLTLAVILGVWFSGPEKAKKNEEPPKQVGVPRQIERPQRVAPPEEGIDAILSQAGLAPSANSDVPTVDVSPKKSLVGEIFGDSGLSGPERVSLLKKLEPPLSASDRDEIYSFFANTSPPDGLPVEAWRWLMDSAFTLLRNDGSDNAGYARQLENIFRNPDGDPIVRDYAVQHLGHLLASGGGSESILPVLRDAIAEKGNSIAGTALLALDQNYPGDQETSDLALRLATDPETHLTSRVTALQVAAAQKNEDALPLAVGLATDSSQPTSLRLSAIAALGQLSSGLERGVLQNLSRSRNHLIKSASTSALQKLTE